MKPGIHKVRVGNLRICEAISKFRKIAEYTVDKYRQNIVQGAVFPPPVVDGKSMEIIDGQQTVHAYIKAYGNDYVIEVMVRNFASTKDKIIFTVEANIKNAMPFTMIAKKLAARMLTDLGVDKAEVARLFNVGVDRIEEWGALGLVVISKDNRQEKLPTKRGLEHLTDEVVSKEDYDDHMAHDISVPPHILAIQLRKWCERNWINLKDPQNVIALQELRPVLNAFMDEHEL